MFNAYSLSSFYRCVSALQAVMATAAGFVIAQNCKNNIMTDV